MSRRNFPDDYFAREREALLHRRGVRSFILGEGERMPNVLECRGGERTLREFSLEVL